MNNTLRDYALQLLRHALNNSNTNFREGQWEAIAELIINRSKLLVVQRIVSMIILLYTR